MTTFKSLAAAVYSDYGTWYRACKKAKQDGWTENQVQSVLLFVHPMTLVAIIMLLVVVGIVVLAND